MASPQDAVAAVRAATEELASETARLAGQFGDTLGVRRLISDVTRLKDDLAELGDPQPGHRPGTEDSDYVVVDDKPYDDSMWQGAESESQHAS